MNSKNQICNRLLKAIENFNKETVLSSSTSQSIPRWHFENNSEGIPSDINDLENTACDKKITKDNFYNQQIIDENRNFKQSLHKCYIDKEIVDIRS